MCERVFTTWLGSRGAPADAAEPTEAGQLQGKFSCPQRGMCLCTKIFGVIKSGLHTTKVLLAGNFQSVSTLICPCLLTMHC